VGFPKDAVKIVVNQIAATINITGAKPINILSPGIPAQLNAVAKDARGNQDVQIGTNQWISTNQNVAQIDATTARSRRSRV